MFIIYVWRVLVIRLKECGTYILGYHFTDNIILLSRHKYYKYFTLVLMGTVVLVSQCQ